MKAVAFACIADGKNRNNVLGGNSGRFEKPRKTGKTRKMVVAAGLLATGVIAGNAISSSIRIKNQPTPEKQENSRIMRKPANSIPEEVVPNHIPEQKGKDPKTIRIMPLKFENPSSIEPKSPSEDGEDCVIM